MRASKTIVQSMALSRLALLGSVFLLVCLFGCGGSQLPMGEKRESASSAELPEITDELIDDRINEAWLRNVPEENGTAAPISWNFDRDEPKKIVVVDKQMNGPSATIVLQIETESSPRARARRQLAGQIRTEWRLKTGWALRRWEIVESENISMKYKDVLAPLPENSNR